MKALDRIVITGGNGFIGRHLVKKLLTDNTHYVVLLSNTSNFLSERELLKSQRLTYYTADVRDRNRILKLIEDESPDSCIHLAAKVSVPDSIRNPDETMEINVNGTVNVLDACTRSQVRNFVFASSAAVYGEVSELPISEDHSLRPLSPYGSSKMLAEQHVWNYGKLNKIQNTISLRIFNVYGVGQTSGSDVVTKFANRLSNGLAPIIHGNGSHTRDFISVDDVTEAILLSVKAMSNNYDNSLDSPPVFNIGSGTATSITGLAEKMISISGLELNPIYEKLDTGAGIILRSYANITKAKRHLRFVAKKNLELGLREVIDQGRI